MNCPFFKYLATSVFIRGFTIIDSFSSPYHNIVQKKIRGVDGQDVGVLRRNRAFP